MYFDNFMGKKRSQKSLKITKFNQNRLFWAIKSKNWPKSKFRFLQFLKNDPKLVSSQFLAYQHHFCKSLCDFQFLVKFSRNHHFCRKNRQKKIRFPQFLKSDPKLVSYQFLAYQHHFCKSLSNFQFLVKFSRNCHFFEKRQRKG